MACSNAIPTLFRCRLALEETRRSASWRFGAAGLTMCASHWLRSFVGLRPQRSVTESARQRQFCIFQASSSRLGDTIKSEREGTSSCQLTSRAIRSRARLSRAHRFDRRRTVDRLPSRATSIRLTKDAELKEQLIIESVRSDLHRRLSLAKSILSRTKGDTRDKRI